MTCPTGQRPQLIGRGANAEGALESGGCGAQFGRIWMALGTKAMSRTCGQRLNRLNEVEINRLISMGERYDGEKRALVRKDSSRIGER